MQRRSIGNLYHLIEDSNETALFWQVKVVCNKIYEWNSSFQPHHFQDELLFFKRIFPLVILLQEVWIIKQLLDNATERFSRRSPTVMPLL